LIVVPQKLNILLKGVSSRVLTWIGRHHITLAAQSKIAFDSDFSGFVCGFVYGFLIV